MGYLFVEASRSFADAEESYSGQTILGFAPPLVIGYGFLLLGVVLVVVWRLFGHEGYFRRQAVRVRRSGDRSRTRGGGGDNGARLLSTTAVELDRARIRELTEREQKRLDESTPGSQRMFERARKTMPGGVASSYQSRAPWPIYIERGEGARVWDVDGRELWDFHNGFGSMVQGHAHPAITKAVSTRIAKGTHFAQPTEDGIVVAEELARRWNLPKWRFLNSGTEATMDAVRIARGLTGRDTVMKIFGSYHGHADLLMVSIGVDYDRIGDRDNLASLPYGGGITDAVVQQTVAVPFNDAEAMERRIARLEARAGCPPA